MPDNWRFSEEEIERDLEDLGAGIEYPPTPDVAHTVSLRLDEEERNRQVRGVWRWLPFLAPRWTAVAAALVLISVFALPHHAHHALGPPSPARRPVRSPQGPRPSPRSAGRETARARGRRALAGRWGIQRGQGRRGHGLPLPVHRGHTGAGRTRSEVSASWPQFLLQLLRRGHARAGSGSTSAKARRPEGSRPSTQTVASPSTPGCACPPMPRRDGQPCWRRPGPANARRSASSSSDEDPSGALARQESRERRCTPSSSSVT
jgi:hypothetical protein